jgi:hypothetical protein
MAMAFSNLAPLGKGLAFRLEQRTVGDAGKGIIGSAVHWESEPVTITVDQALAATDGRAEQHAPRREAEDLLRDMRSGFAWKPLMRGM